MSIGGVAGDEISGGAAGDVSSGEIAGGLLVLLVLWTGLDRGWGVPKIPKFVQTSFVDDP